MATMLTLFGLLLPHVTDAPTFEVGREGVCQLQIHALQRRRTRGAELFCRWFTDLQPDDATNTKDHHLDALPAGTGTTVTANDSRPGHFPPPERFRSGRFC